MPNAKRTQVFVAGLQARHSDGLKFSRCPVELAEICWLEINNLPKLPTFFSLETPQTAAEMASLPTRVLRLHICEEWPTIFGLALFSAMDTEKIAVFARVRPLSGRNSHLEVDSDRSMVIISGRPFEFDGAFGPESTQASFMV